jgi:cbb3-type cytochrome c oxidase subunit III
LLETFSQLTKEISMENKRIILASLFAGIAVLAGQAAVAADGKSIFSGNCAACHGANGQGTAGLAPALKGDKFVAGDIKAVIDTVKNGRAGEQKRFKDMPVAMPAWGKQLSDADIKAVVDYIRGDLQK